MSTTVEYAMRQVENNALYGYDRRLCRECSAR